MDENKITETNSHNRNSEETLNDSIENVFSKEDAKCEDVFKIPVLFGPRRGFKVIKRPTIIEGDAQSEINEKANDSEEIGTVIDTTKNESSNKIPPLPYSEPIWKGKPQENYTLEELKSGVIQKTINLSKKSLSVIGRVDSCDVVMAHPTISRYHAVLQYRGVPDGELDKGFYLYDLDSTHGTFLNKARLKPKVYARIKVGHIIKFGCSTRFFLVQGPKCDEEDESELSMTELKEKRKLELEEKKRQKEEELKLQEEEEERERKLIEERGISWGLGEDADEEDDLTENPYAITTNEELYNEDPKKSLRHWYEREGEELQFETEQVEKGMIACKVVLPLDDEHGRDIIIETTARSKKEATLQCALEACRTIDRMGLFRQAKQEAKKRQARDWEENDYYDSDEDNFLDRTGDLDTKRKKRMAKAGKTADTVETYETLTAKHMAVLKKLEEAESKLQGIVQVDKVKTEPENEDIDALDAFMKTLKQDKPGKLDLKITKEEIFRLKKEEDQLRKLVNIVKPTSMPELKPVHIEVQSSIKKEMETSTAGHIQNDGSSKKLDSTNSKKYEEALSSKESKNKPERVLGPTFPDQLKDLKSQPMINKKSKRKMLKKIDESKMETEDEDFTNLVWQPPKGQTGDGRTTLNDKLGY